jgi:U3 small nucleolar RNA-associated protein 21
MTKVKSKHIKTPLKAQKRNLSPPPPPPQSELKLSSRTVVGTISDEEDNNTSIVPMVAPNHSKLASSLETSDFLGNTKKSKILSHHSGISRLFVPYRSLGVLSDRVPFYLLQHETSATSTLVLSTGDRFQMLRCDTLQPVLVSQPIVALNNDAEDPNTLHHKNKHRSSPILRLVSNASLSITVVAHGATFPQLTLVQRAKPIHSLPLGSRYAKKNNYNLVDMISLGTMKVQCTGEKEGKMENALLLALLLCHTSAQREDDDQNSNVIIVGDDEDDDDHDSNNDLDDDDESALPESHALGRVVIVLATRETLCIHSHWDLPIHPTTCIHPSSYVNKILIGGYDGALLLMNIRSGKILHNFQCIRENNERVTCLEQSPAIDTVAIGCYSGSVHLVNLRYDKHLFSLGHNSPVTSLSFRTDASALRHNIAPMAVGRLDGVISIWDLSPPDVDDEDDYEEKPTTGKTLLCEMLHVHPGGVAAIQFMPQEPLLVSTGISSNSVLFHVFDNPDHSGRLWKSRKGHTSPPQCIRYLHPATNGLLAQAADGTDASSCQILSGGGSDRTLRIFSSARSVLDKEYSQGAGLERQSKKLGLTSTAELLLPPITAITSSDAHSRDWGDLVTIHQHHAMAYVWSSRRGAQSGPVLRQSHWNISAMKVPPPKKAHATSVAISSCGNYAVVGTLGGTIYKYNIQSGIPRGSYPPQQKEGQTTKTKEPGSIQRTIKNLEKKFKVSNRKSDKDKEERDKLLQRERELQRKEKLRSATHRQAVTGLAVDTVNKTLISVGLDAKLILWNFRTHAPHKKSPYMLPSGATQLCHIRDSDLAAIALKDFTVVLFDCSSLRLVRRFGSGLQNHTGPISDLAFAPDGRTLYTASLDRTIRVWDVPTNSCVDWLGFKTAPTSLTVSPTGEFLATTHVDRLGIYLWSDRTYYQTVFLDSSSPPTMPYAMDEPVPIAETLTKSSSGEDMISGNEDFNMEERIEKDLTSLSHENEPPKPKGGNLITLSGLPPSHWKNLFHLELVKERNKPEEAPQKPPEAPFFLQWRKGENLNERMQDSDTKLTGSSNDVWAAAWSDDDNVDEENSIGDTQRKDLATLSTKRMTTSPSGTRSSSNSGIGKSDSATEPKSKKRRVIVHHRSHLASLLQECSRKTNAITATTLIDDSNPYEAVTDYIVTLGPSAIDVSLLTLCHGMHDLEEGLPLLYKASMWLMHATSSRQRYEAIHAYLHRFLHLHANTIAGIEEYSNTITGPDDDKDTQTNNKSKTETEYRDKLLEVIKKLRQLQKADGLKDKLQHSLCLLQHFLRMV